ncbi:unnamed protein product [Albugo candida]|uniref:Uncharacterized protein n=1 Tax=Albugo candida TaxID=65357 RepID=A0A024G3V7_9STRA|nr:unnamed protein product [Albugo candida]|eukprot:CCI41346.1 unnamed protein product [Albugo candida]
MTAWIVCLIFVAILTPLLYIFITWDHDLARSFPALPSPSDLGTREFLWRCRLSKYTKWGWKKSILRSPCPMINLQCRFALLSSDFAKLTATLGYEQLKLETIPFIFPQIAISSLFLQILGHSKFPASVESAHIKALSVCQLRQLNMQFPDQVPVVLEESETAEDSSLVTSDFVGFQCLMILQKKRFLETEIEFDIQTDLYDEKGCVWQSVTTFSIPFKQEILMVPLSKSVAQLDPQLEARQDLNEKIVSTISCSKSKLLDFMDVSVAGFGLEQYGRLETPLMWTVGNLMAILQRQDRVPKLPLLASFVFASEHEKRCIPLGKPLTCSSWTNKETNNTLTKVDVSCEDEKSIVRGFLRTVGWNYVET